MKSSNEHIEQPKDQHEKVSFFQKIVKMDNMTSMAVLAFCGSSILIAPAAIYIALGIYHLFADSNVQDKSNIPDLSSTNLNDLRDPVKNIVRWSFFLTTMWLVWLILYFFFLYAPYLLSRWILLSYGYVSVRAEQILDYIPQVFYPLTICSFLILAAINFRIIFNQFQLVDWWMSILQTILTLMVFSICSLIQRIIVQKIAHDFNLIAYNDRVQKSKRDMKLIDKLRKSVKRGGVLGFLDADMRLSNTMPSKNSLRGVSPNRGFAEFLGPSISTIGASSHRKRSIPNIVQFFKPSSPTTTSENIEKKSSNNSLPSSFGDSHHAKPIRFSVEDKYLSKRASLGDKPKDVEHSPKRSKKHLVSSDPNIYHSATSASDKNVEYNSDVVLLLSDNLESASPDQTSPFSDQSLDDSKKQNPNQIESSLSDKNKDLEKVMIGGIKKRDRVLDLSGDYEAQKLAQRVWLALRQKSSQELTIKNFYTLFPVEEEAREMFDFLDVERNGKLSFEEIKGTLQMIYKEKRHLHFSLNDLSHALGHLNYALYSCSAFVTLLLALPIYGVSMTAILPFTSFFLALSFIFGGALRTAFDCIVFIFVRHPYDSGDQIIIEDKVYVVLEVSLLETVLRTDGKICYYPNGDLAQKSIINIRRSGDLSDYVVIGVSCSVTEEKMKQLHEAMLIFCQSQKTRLKPACNMTVLELGPIIKFQFSIEYKGNWQDATQRWVTKSMFLFEMKRVMQEMQIEL